MATSLQTVDPGWAWSAWKPTTEQPWTRTTAAHLFRRLGFGANWTELNDAVEKGPQATLERLLQPGEAATAFDNRMETLAASVLATNNPERLSAWWLYRMIGTPSQAKEKLTLFWHGHFATSAAKVEDSDMMLAQYRLLRKYALGSFRPLVQEISRDPAMLMWLDSTVNRRSHPNENYARELMELFCLGVGNYTERDIQEVARAFTGWELRLGRFQFNRFYHDPREKSFLGQTGAFDGDDAVRIVLDQPAAPRFLARKLFKYLVADEPELPANLLEPLAQTIREFDFDMGRVVQTICRSNLFYSPHSVGRKIRSPVEFAVGLLRSLQGTTNVYRLAEGLKDLGQAVFYPPNVKGWDGGRTWINSATLLGRANLTQQLLRAEETRFAGGKGLAEVFRSAGVELEASGSGEQLVDHLTELLLAVPPSAAVRASLIDLADQKISPADKRLARVLHAFCALPEYQLG